MLIAPMPLIPFPDIHAHAKIGLWHIAEDESFFASADTALPISHSGRRHHHLAARHLLSELVPGFPFDRLRRSPAGKPFLEGHPFHFSLSHAGHYAVAALSHRGPVGVDLEFPRTALLRIRKRFTSPTEEARLEASVPDLMQRLTLIWSLKEAVFKWYGAGRVDFRQDIVLSDYTPGANHMGQTRIRLEKEGGLWLNGVSVMLEQGVLSVVVSE